MQPLKSRKVAFSDYLGKIKHRGRTMLLPALLEAQKKAEYNGEPFDFDKWKAEYFGKLDEYNAKIASLSLNK